MWKEETARQRKRRKSMMLIKWSIGIGSLFVALLPTWGFMLLYHIAGPTNFMEKATMIGMGLFFAGGFQIFMFLLWFWFITEMADWQ